MLLTGNAFGATPSNPVLNSRKNIIFFLVDDLGWADLSCYGSTFHETPAIDALAQSGVRFTHAYAACPVCSPTRASIITGRHPVRVGITDWIPGQNIESNPISRFLHIHDKDQLPLDEITFAEVLKQNDYQTCFVGKWHLGDKGFLPTDQGYDVNVGGFSRGSPPGGYYAPFRNPYLPDKMPGEYLTSRLTDEAIAFINQRDPHRPFLMSFCYYNVHTPIQPDTRVIQHYQEKAALLKGDTPTEREHAGQTRLRQDNPDYASMVAAVDTSIARMMEALKKQDITDETIIIFFSDNGGLSTKKTAGPTCNLPLRAGKGWLYEGGVREPLIIRAPGISEPGRIVNIPVVSMDFFPTILELCNVTPKTLPPLDGTSIAGLLQGNLPTTDRTFYWHYPHYHGSTWTPGASIRHGRWKLIEFYHLETVELYDLQNDPGERNNLVDAYPERVAELRRRLSAWQKRMGATMPVDKS